MPKLEHKFVVADGAVRLKPFTDDSEIHRASVFMNLHRIAPAEGDMGPSLPGQVDEFAPPASPAIRARSPRLESGGLVAPGIPGKQGGTQLLPCSRQQL